MNTMHHRSAFHIGVAAFSLSLASCVPRIQRKWSPADRAARRAGGRVGWRLFAVRHVVFDFAQIADVA